MPDSPQILTVGSPNSYAAAHLLTLACTGFSFDQALFIRVNVFNHVLGSLATVQTILATPMQVSTLAPCLSALAIQSKLQGPLDGSLQPIPPGSSEFVRLVVPLLCGFCKVIMVTEPKTRSDIVIARECLGIETICGFIKGMTADTIDFIDIKRIEKNLEKEAKEKRDRIERERKEKELWQQELKMREERKKREEEEEIEKKSVKAQKRIQQKQHQGKVEQERESKKNGKSMPQQPMYSVSHGVQDRVMDRDRHIDRESTMDQSIPISVEGAHRSIPHGSSLDNSYVDLYGSIRVPSPHHKGGSKRYSSTVSSTSVSSGVSRSGTMTSSTAGVNGHGVKHAESGKNMPLGSATPETRALMEEEQLLEGEIQDISSHISAQTRTQHHLDGQGLPQSVRGSEVHQQPKGGAGGVGSYRQTQHHLDGQGLPQSVRGSEVHQQPKGGAGGVGSYRQFPPADAGDFSSSQAGLYLDDAAYSQHQGHPDEQGASTMYPYSSTSYYAGKEESSLLNPLIGGKMDLLKEKIRELEYALEEKERGEVVPELYHILISKNRALHQAVSRLSHENSRLRERLACGSTIKGDRLHGTRVLLRKSEDHVKRLLDKVQDLEVNTQRGLIAQRRVSMLEKKMRVMSSALNKRDKALDTVIRRTVTQDTASRGFESENVVLKREIVRMRSHMNALTQDLKWLKDQCVELQKTKKSTHTSIYSTVRSTSPAHTRVTHSSLVQAKGLSAKLKTELAPSHPRASKMCDRLHKFIEEAEKGGVGMKRQFATAEKSLSQAHQTSNNALTTLIKLEQSLIDRLEKHCKEIDGELGLRIEGEMSHKGIIMSVPVPPQKYQGAGRKMMSSSSSVQSSMASTMASSKVRFDARLDPPRDGTLSLASLGV
ncbi:hypothetical protein ADUPG1_006661 [Aduncisulcus paluster]|uniref:Uncharacterized protein n=1 Tax=Aduncisulcus paluster TaxID=2918883 RepID=A0ABQ5KJ16_9EUKA|nr:hypothetical protein ADUPG1_006661 [Aduncisulcus paluster]